MSPTKKKVKQTSGKNIHRRTIIRKRGNRPKKTLFNANFNVANGGTGFQVLEEVSEAGTDCATHEEDLFEKVRTQWQFGDWDGLAKLSIETIQDHSEREKLALFAAAGLLQYGDTRSGRKYAYTAKKWGADKKMMSRVLISGVYNTLGFASALCRQNQKAVDHLEKAIAIGSPGGDVRLLTRIRIDELGKKNGLIDVNRLNKKVTVESEEKEEMDFSSAKLIVDECFANEDLIEAIESINKRLLSPSLTKTIRFNFCYLLALRFIKEKDNLTVAHFINSAYEFAEEKGQLAKTQLGLLSKVALEIGQVDLSIDLMVRSQCAVYADNEQKRIIAAYRKIRADSRQKKQHGQDLLLCYLKEHLKSFAATEQKRTLIEVGTTRENVPGQGSTRLFAELCKGSNIHFITIDMDPNNSQMAGSMFAQMEVPFEAITMKGEDYLQNYHGTFDFVFLDAYDFDHGNHSALRQSRYRKYLGGIIDEEQCYQMHLDCAESIIEKLSDQGVVCIDDTWQDEQGNWTAKGTLAVPFLLENGFGIIEARNRAVLLKRN